MTDSSVPRPSQGQDDLLGKPPVHPAASEASRLLCAGVRHPALDARARLSAGPGDGISSRSRPGCSGPGSAGR
ncbi:hypothetical protein B1H20_22385 [Streptomyces violaceoruber]|uniref:Uncharacterized protein n=1 Tax=Streptomyces violaceoruber TaxID=1935 RepID=A0A1V0UF04_STRVN|nr:hypothetical protein B1H20_22385 [Streptomyces violaceoruber]